jgi:hypothetical protein
MKEIANKPNEGVPAAQNDSGLDDRIFRTMAITVALSVIGTIPFFPGRVTTGLLVGGLLSLLNHHWMRTSISAVFDQTLVGAKPRIKVVRYVLRYLVIGATVYAAYRLDLVSLPATLVGLCSFVVALFVEAFREFYFAIIRREEIN